MALFVTAASPMNEPISIWSGPIPTLAPESGPPPLNRVRVRADARDPRPHRDQRPGGVLHVRLRRGIPQDRGALGANGRHQGILSPGDARLVEEEVRAMQLLRLDGVIGADIHPGAEPFERKKVGVNAASTDHIATGRRQHDLAEPGEQWSGKQDRGPNFRAQPGIEGPWFKVARIDRDRAFAPGHIRTQEGDQFEERLDIADPGHIGDGDRTVGEERGGDDGEGGVLVSRRANGAAERAAAGDNEAWWHAQ